jgi:hypothetical protein
VQTKFEDCVLQAINTGKRQQRQALTSKKNNLLLKTVRVALIARCCLLVNTANVHAGELLALVRGI